MFAQVLKEIERMGAYDPLIIKLDRRFYKSGWLIVCNANLTLNPDWFVEGRPTQNPNSLSYNKIKTLYCKVKYVYFET